MRFSMVSSTLTSNSSLVTRFQPLTQNSALYSFAGLSARRIHLQFFDWHAISHVLTAGRSRNCCEINAKMFHLFPNCVQNKPTYVYFHITEVEIRYCNWCSSSIKHREIILNRSKAFPEYSMIHPTTRAWVRTPYNSKSIWIHCVWEESLKQVRSRVS